MRSPYRNLAGLRRWVQQHISAFQGKSINARSEGRITHKGPQTGTGSDAEDDVGESGRNGGDESGSKAANEIARGAGSFVSGEVSKLVYPRLQPQPADAVGSIGAGGHGDGGAKSAAMVRLARRERDGARSGSESDSGTDTAFRERISGSIPTASEPSHPTRSSPRLLHPRGSASSLVPRVGITQPSRLPMRLAALSLSSPAMIKK